MQQLRLCGTEVWDIAGLLDRHDPARVSAIAGQLRRMIDCQIWTLAPDLIDYPAACRDMRSATLLIKRNRDLAFPLSTSASGFVREYALARINRVPGPFTLALLLLRLNDHVARVQLAATGVLRSLLARPPAKSGLTAETVVDCMDVLLTTARFSRLRGPQREIIRRLRDAPGVQQRFEDLVKSERSDRAPRYAALGLQLGLLDRLAPELVVSARHAGVRRLALKSCLDRTGTATDPLIGTALRDRSREVVSMALQRVLDDKGSAHHKQAVFERLLTNPSLSIADRAGFALRSLGIDLLPLLRRAVAGSSLSLSAIVLLSRYGSPADARAILDAQSGFGISGRIKCLQAAATLGSEDAATQLKLVILMSTCDDEARLASKALAAAGLGLSFVEIVRIVEAGQDVAKRGVLRFARALPTIRFAQVVALAVSRNLACDYQALWDQLEEKRRRTPFFPSQAEIEDLRRLVADQPVLAESMRRVLGV